MTPEDEHLLGESAELDLTTTGRATGQPRTVELWFAYESGCLYFLAGMDEKGVSTHWRSNLEANPDATVQCGDKSFNVLAEAADSGVAEVRALFLRKYGDAVMRQWYARPQYRVVRLRVLGVRS